MNDPQHDWFTAGLPESSTSQEQTTNMPTPPSQPSADPQQAEDANNSRTELEFPAPTQPEKGESKAHDPKKVSGVRF